MENNVSQQAEEALQSLRAKVPEALTKPVLSIICGSGLGGLANIVLNTSQFDISYSDIPHFPESTVLGHAGKLRFGLLRLDRRPVVLMLGRLHYYEGYSIQNVTFPIRVMKRLGVDTLLVTNAAGGLNQDYSVGDLIILNDHINIAGLSGIHPLRGPNADDFGVRFPPLSDTYDLSLRRRAHQLWKLISHEPSSVNRLHEGTYAFVGGPSYETRAECRMLLALGADLVGMSSVPEVIVARHCRIRVFALSIVTNNAVLEAGPRGDDALIRDASRQELSEALEKGKATHTEVLDAGQKAATKVQQFMALLACDILDADYASGVRENTKDIV